MGKENLRVPTSEEARRNGALGGNASVEARRKKKLLRECLDELLEKEYETKQGKMLGAEALAAQLMKKALGGDTKAFEVLRDTAGQKPIERVEVSTPKAKMAEEIEAALQEIQGGGVNDTGANSGPDAAD